MVTFDFVTGGFDWPLTVSTMKNSGRFASAADIQTQLHLLHVIS